MKLSVVIPAYNEQKDIKQVVLEVYRRFHTAEIIVINDASTDKTLQILTTVNVGNFINLKVLTNKKNRGHGYSVVRGLKAATGDYILYIDADRQIDILYMPTEYFIKKYDVISGRRINRQDKLFRKTISFCLKMTNLFFNSYYIPDANCPFKIYKRTCLRKLLPLLPKTYIIPIAELEVLARKYGYRTTTIKVLHLPYNGIRKGFLQTFNMNFIKFVSKAFMEIVQL